jgi:hypothetical protein
VWSKNLADLLDAVAIGFKDGHFGAGSVSSAPLYVSSLLKISSRAIFSTTAVTVYL